MTALSEYQRLESTGLWRPAPGAQRRDVIVSIGEASLVITDMSDRALAHWSLPAVERANPGEAPALYRPGTDATEDLEIDDATMIAAIERVRAAVARRRPRPGRLRQGIVLTLLAALLLAAALWLPGAVVRHTAGVVPPAQRAQIGATLLGEVRRVAGAPCDGAAGVRALGRLRQRLGLEEAQRLVVLPEGIAETAHLPGGIYLLNRRLVEDFDTPEVAAGYLLAEAERAQAEDPLLGLLRRAGPLAAFRLLTTGRLPETALEREAERLMALPRPPAPEGPLLERFAAARLSPAPYVLAREITDEASATLIAAAEGAAGSAPVLDDGDWVALQGICGG